MTLLAALPDGMLAFGYGDYDTNTGPIDLLGLDPASGDWSVLYNDAPTEEINAGTVIDGYLWVPSIDPVGSGDGTLITNAPSGTWRLVTVDVAGKGPAVHLYGVAGQAGVLYVCGARRILVSEGNVSNIDVGAAIVWKSTDDGDTWTEDLAYLGDNTDAYLRFYYFRNLGGELCVLASDYSHHWTLNAGTWRQHSGAPTPIISPHPGYTYAIIGSFTYLCDGATVYRTIT